MTTPREPRRIEHPGAPSATAPVDCDLCIVGAGAAGVSAAIEASRLGLQVTLVDSLPQIGGQSVNGLISTLCGFYDTAPEPRLLQHGFAGELLAELDAAGALSFRRGRSTLVALYDENEMAAAYARHLLKAGVRVVLGAVLGAVTTQASHAGRRLQALQVHTRYGAFDIRARTYLDASGDAALAAAAGLPVQSADAPVYGTSMFSLTGLGPSVPPRDVIEQRLRATAASHGLQRRDGFVFSFPGRDLCLVNMVHYETPLDAIAMSRVALQARELIDRVEAFLRAEFPAAFADARVLAIGQPGVRQTRGIVGRATLTTEAVRSGTRPGDAVARSAWPIEFHGTLEGVHWETFAPGHVAWVPLSALVARDADNLLAAGRCIDAEPYALSAVRVIGPCMAMGAAAAAAASVSRGSLHEIDPRQVQAIVRDNLERQDVARAV